MKKIYTIILASFFAISVNAQTALTFDGVDDQVNFSNSTPFDVIGNVTVEAKVKMNTVLDYQAFVTNMDYDANSAYRGYWLGTDDLGYALWFIGDTNLVEDGEYLYSQNLIDDGSWHHVAGVVKGDSAFLYVDGVLDTAANIPNLSLASAGLFTFGTDVDGYLYAGELDDVRFWNVSQTASDISLLKDSCLTGSETGLVMFQHFEQGAGGLTTYDLTSNGYDGTMSNMDMNGSWVAGINCQQVSTNVNIHNKKELTSVYPNPNKGTITVQLNGLNNVSINIYNVTGKLIYNANSINETTHQINLNGNPGLYLLEINSNEGSQYHKLMKN